MTDNQVVLDWTIALCEQAVKEKNEGNVALLNKIGGNGALQTFFANAFSIHSVQYSQFSKQFPTQWKEIVGLHEAYEKEQLAEAEQSNRMDTIEAKIGSLETMLKDFIESQKPVEPAKKPAKKGKVEEPVTEDTDESTESEA